jgi:2-hydroxy-3-keto-5-methylthiopentenyl-1-phosphate phosphatase
LRQLPGLSAVGVVSNRLRCVGDRWFAEFPPPEPHCTHGCATCKPAALERLAPAGVLRAFVGDGLSDRHAARVADIVFAKGDLAAFCERAGIAYTPFDTLTAVAECVTPMFREQ